MPELAFLLVGRTDRAEFAEVRASLAELGAVLDAVDPIVAESLLRQHSPDVIVLAQAFPGEFSSAAVDRLRVRAPLARFVALLGSWCEGEGRTGQPWPACLRIYWHQWASRAIPELGRLRDGLPSTFSLPLTVSEEERALAAAERPVARREGLVVVRSAEYAMFECLAGACRAVGREVVSWRSGELPLGRAIDAGLFDVAECDAEEIAQLRAFADAIAPAPVVAIAGFPRIDDCRRLRGSGATAVVSKPFQLEDLTACLPAKVER
jgi:DNA-binding NarL/FixJ family response regulator